MPLYFASHLHRLSVDSLHAAAVGGWKQSNAIEESLLQVLWLPGLLSEGPCVPRVWGIVQESSSGTRRFVGAAALCNGCCIAIAERKKRKMVQDMAQPPWPEFHWRWLHYATLLHGLNWLRKGYVSRFFTFFPTSLCGVLVFLVGHSRAHSSFRLPPPPPTQLVHTQLAHTQLTRTQLTHTQLVHTQLVRTQLVRTQLTARDRATSSFAAPSCVWPKIEPASLTLARNQSVPPEPRAKFESFEISSSWILSPHESWETWES